MCAMAAAHSKINWVGTLKMGGKLSAVLATIFFSSRLLCKFDDKSKKQIQLEQESIPIENFQYDPVSFKILGQLWKWKTYNPYAYEKCMETTDILLRIRENFKNLLTKRPSVREIARAQSIYCMGRSYLDKFYNDILEVAPENIPPDQMVRLEDDISNVIDYWDLTLISIFNLTTCI